MNHTLLCGKAVDARGLHGLCCRRRAHRQRHSHLNDILLRAIKPAQMPAVKEPINLMRDDNKRPDWTTLLPWARGKPMAWDVTVPDTYAESHIGNTATKPGAAAQKTAQNKIDKYSKLASTHIFYPFAIETAGTWHEMATELTQAYHHYHRRHPGDNIPVPTLFNGSAKRKCGFFPQHHGHRVNCRCNHNFVCLA